MFAVLALLAAAQTAPPATGMRVEELSNGQFRISITRRGSNARAAVLADAMLRVEMETRREATRRCQGLGGPVPVDRGQINLLPGNLWETVQTFACRTPAAPPPPPTEG